MKDAATPAHPASEANATARSARRPTRRLDFAFRPRGARQDGHRAGGSRVRAAGGDARRLRDGHARPADAVTLALLEALSCSDLPITIILCMDSTCLVPLAPDETSARPAPARLSEAAAQPRSGPLSESSTNLTILI